LPSGKKTPAWRKLYYADGSLPESATINAEWGYALDYLEGSDDAKHYFPLRDVSTATEVDAYPWPDVGADYRYAGLKDKVESLHQSGFPVIMGGYGVFENTWALCGFEKLMMEMADDSPIAHRLFDRMAELQVKTAEQTALCGVDVMSGGGDVATQLAPMMSPDMWRNWIFPVMRDCIKAAKQIKPDILVLYHSDGNVEPLIDGFIEAGVDILDPIQPECMDIFALKKRYGDRLSFHGGIGVQSTLPFGTPQEVRDTVRRTIDVMAEGGGYLCSSAHMLRPEIPWENVMAFVETVKEYKL
jgi:uroporphyrinogen decarboxylase